MPKPQLAVWLLELCAVQSADVRTTKSLIRGLLAKAQPFAGAVNALRAIIVSPLTKKSNTAV